MTSINDLTDDCLFKIFKFIPIEDRVTKLINVSRRWRALALRCIEHVSLNENNRSIPATLLPYIIKLKSLKYKPNCDEPNLKLMSPITDRALSNLIELEVGIPILASPDLQRISKLCTRLTSLKLYGEFYNRNAFISEKNCEEFFRSIGPRLRHFEMHCIILNNLNAHLNPSTNEPLIFPHLKHMPNLVELVIYDFEMTDRSDLYFSPNLTLRKLSIGIAQTIKEFRRQDIIRFLSDCYPNLEHLSINQYGDFFHSESRDFLNLSRLINIETLEVKFKFFGLMRSIELRPILRTMKNLKCLSLYVRQDYGDNLLACIADNAPQLRKLTLRLSDHQIKWSLMFSELRKLQKLESATLQCSVQLYGRITVDEAAAQILSCPRLRELEVVYNYCRGGYNEILEFPVNEVERQVSQRRDFRLVFTEVPFGE